MIVVDASVLATALGDDGPDGRRVRVRLAGERIAAPEIIDLEVASVYRRLNRVGRFDDERAAQALADLADLRLTRVPHRTLIPRCWELRHNVTVYDAAYIALAEILQSVLLTADARLANAPGSRCTFEVIA